MSEMSNEIFVGYFCSIFAFLAFLIRKLKNAFIEKQQNLHSKLLKFQSIFKLPDYKSWKSINRTKIKVENSYLCQIEHLNVTGAN